MEPHLNEESEHKLHLRHLKPADYDDIQGHHGSGIHRDRHGFAQVEICPAAESIS